MLYITATFNSKRTKLRTLASTSFDVLIKINKYIPSHLVAGKPKNPALQTSHFKPSAFGKHGQLPASLHCKIDDP